MSLQKKERENFLYGKKLSVASLKKTVQSIGSRRSIASIIARWFDEICVERYIRPNLKGEMYFTILLSELLRHNGERKLSAGFKKIMKEYGYTIRRTPDSKNLLEVKKLAVE